jgi:predicted RNA methylase
MSTGYNCKGLYNQYDKNNKEREALDYYSTPTEEVTNILEVLKMRMDDTTILEPSCGGGHMVEGIIKYASEIGEPNYKIIATDIKDRGYHPNDSRIETHYNLDFFADDYGEKFPPVEFLIMNPPYSVIEPFVIRALEIPTKGVLMLARLQFLEGEKRYKKILKETPPSDIYIYVDRIYCYKNGDSSEKKASAQAYAWFYFDIQKIKSKEKYDTNLHWIRKVDKK